MFSCFFLEGNKLCTPTKCEVEMTSDGFNCTGKAFIRIDTSHPMESAILYVPSLLQHSTAGGRSTLRLTKCDIKAMKNSTIVSSETCHLVKTNWHSPNLQLSRISYSMIKSTLEKLILEYGVSQSSKDVLLHIGRIDTGTTLNVQLNFISNLLPSTSFTTSVPTINWYYMTLLPATEISLSIYMKTPDGTDIHSVFAVNTDSTQLNHTVSSSNYITAKLSTHSTSEFNQPPGIGVSLVTKQPIIGVCHTMLMEKPLVVNEQTIFDGIHTVNYMFTPVNEDSEMSLLPAEFVFMVDCSGSMSGSKIQSAAESLLFAIKSLPDTCYFNVIAFGSKFRALFQSSVAVSYKTIEHGVQFANQLKACLGGTELLTPLRRINKKPPEDGLLRNIFLITDGGVPNIQLILQTAIKHRNTTRFHTFALGPDICSELMAGVAAETGGQYRVVNDTNRLQTKVMEVFQTCLKPTLQNLSVTWCPPSGFTNTDTSHLSLPSHLSPGLICNKMSILTKVSNTSSNNDTSSFDSSVTITGSFQKQQAKEAIQCTISSVPEKDYTEATIAMLQHSAWYQMSVLEEKLLQPQHQREEILEDDNGSPPAKKPCINGIIQSDHDAIREELVKISLMSGVPCFPYTYFQSLSSSLVQILPWNESKPLAVQNDPNLLSVYVPIRKRPRSKVSSTAVPSMLPSLSFSFTSFAERTASAINSIVKASVNVVSFGLVNLDNDASMEIGGHRIEDQEYYQKQADYMHWDKDGQLILPKCYYISEGGNENLAANNDKPQLPFKEDTTSDFKNVSEQQQHLPGFDYKISPDMKLEDCSLQAYYIPLIQMQLPSGAWSLSPALAAVINVPLTDILQLPVSNGHSSHYSSDSGKNQGHGWATALALAFLQFHYSSLKLEWNLIAYKANQWLISNKDCIPLPISEVNKTSLQLITH